MENKYYVPVFEEFHKGFEYQQIEMCSLNSGPKQLQYIDKICTGNEGHYIDVGIEYGKIRVKYLDQQDIEDCGWKHSNTSETTEYYNMREMSLYHDPIDNEVTIHEVQYNWDSCLFRGTIKNKSEFKKLMKQLNITKE